MAGASASAELPRERGRSQPGARKAQSKSPKAVEQQQAAQAGLDLLRVLGWLVLHDVAMPDRPEIAADHVVVGPSGVYVVHRAPWTGAVTFRDGDLIAGGVPRTAELDEVATATDAIRDRLGDRPVAAILCLVHSEPVAGVAGGVAVCTTENILDLLTRQPAVLDTRTQQAVARALGEALTAAGPRPAIAPPTPVPSAKHRHRPRLRKRRTAAEEAEGVTEPELDVDEAATVETTVEAPVAAPPPPPPAAPSSAPPAPVAKAPEPPKPVRAPAAPPPAERVVLRVVESPAEPKTEPKVEPKVEAKVEAKPESKTEPKIEPKAELARAAEELAAAEEERRRIEEIRRKAAEERKQAVLAQQRAVEDRVRAEAELRKAADERARATRDHEERMEVERARAAEERERLSQDRRQAEQAQAKAIAERKKAAEERRQAEHARARAEAEGRKAARERAAAEQAAAKRVAADRAAAARIEAARVESVRGDEVAGVRRPAYEAEPLPKQGRSSMRAVMPAVVAAAVIVVIVAVIPQVPSWVDWGKSLFGAKPDPAFGTTLVVDRTTYHPALQLFAGTPVTTQSTGGAVPRGSQLVAIRLRLQNAGADRWVAPLTSRLVAVDSLGVEHRLARGITGVKAGRMLPSTIRVDAQALTTGVATFEVPAGRTITEIKLQLSSDRNDSVHWTTG
jgi:hypothetical protein